MYFNLKTNVVIKNRSSLHKSMIGLPTTNPNHQFNNQKPALSDSLNALFSFTQSIYNALSINALCYNIFNHSFSQLLLFYIFIYIHYSLYFLSFPSVLVKWSYKKHFFLASHRLSPQHRKC